MALAPRLKISRAEQKTLSSQLSPFELKDKLIHLARETSRQSDEDDVRTGSQIRKAAEEYVVAWKASKS
jgi:hypothetical protein